MSRIGEEFIKKTKYRYLEESDQVKGLSQPPLEPAVEKEGKRIKLPQPREIAMQSTDLREAIESRISVREYSSEPLSLEELSFLLWCTQGVKKVIPAATLRTVPSAGARHALETYLLANRVQQLQAGLYRFSSLRHELIQLNIEPGLADRLVEACLGQAFVKTSAATFIWSAVVYRMTWRYGERGYRYLYLDTGHVCQNLYLSAEAVGCGACAIGAFSDDEVNRLLELDGQEQFAIYLAAVGKI